MVKKGAFKVLRMCMTVALSVLIGFSSTQVSYAYNSYMEYSYGDTFGDGMVVFKNSKGELGYKNSSGKVVIPAGAYYNVYDFNDGMALIDEVGYFGYINKKGKKVIDLSAKGYHSATGSFYNGITVATEYGDGRYNLAIFNKKGKLLAKSAHKYDTFFLSNNYIVVVKDGKYGLINRKGKEIVKPQYDDINYEDELTHTIGFNKNGKWGLLNTKGKVLVKPIYDYELASSEELINTCIDGKWGFIDARSYETVIEFKYDAADWFINNEAPVKLNDKWMMIDSSGKKLFDIDSDYVEVVSTAAGVFAVRDVNDRWGIIDEDGNTVVRPKYIEKLSFDKGTGLARAVRENGTVGFIDKYGKTKLAFK